MQPATSADPSYERPAKGGGTLTMFCFAIRAFAIIVGLTALLVLAGCKLTEPSSSSDVMRQVEAARNAEVPLPSTTPFDSAPESRDAYLAAYRDGYRSALASFNVLFRKPKDSDAIRKKGWDDGSLAGYRLLTEGPPPPPPTKCPFGHSELKRVPIIYGLLLMDAALERKIENLEVWQGGCVVGDEKEKLVCNTC